jgi:hypothetical protein
MKHLRHAVVLILALAAVPAFGASSLLTPDGIRYAIEQTPNLPQVEITRAEGEARARLVVPSTEDATSESQAQLAYDLATETLFVVWTRDKSSGSEIRYATLNAAGQWSSPQNIAAGSAMYRGVQLVLTRSEHADVVATLMHVAWWSINGPIADPEYALFGFEGGVRVSAEVANLEELAAAGDGPSASDFEQVAEAIHPPLTMARSGETIDLAFGSTTSTSITRLNVAPRKIGVNVRIWKPVGRSVSRTPSIGMVVPDSTSAIHAFIDNGRLALYTLGEHFSWVVLRSDNTWSAMHSVKVDEENTASDLLRDLRQTVQELQENEELSGESEEEHAATH